jgi:Flp pilus assembly protein TadG
MLYRKARRPGRRRAAAAVELAILLPLICFLLVAAVDYARVFYCAVTVENCARNGAYFASNYPNASYLYNDIYGYKNLDEAILKDASNLYDPARPSSKPTYEVRYGASPSGPFDSSSATANSYVRVTVHWTFHCITSYPGIPKTVNVSRSCVMKVAPAMPDFPDGVPYDGNGQGH